MTSALCIAECAFVSFLASLPPLQPESLDIFNGSTPSLTSSTTIPCVAGTGKELSVDLAKNAAKALQALYATSPNASQLNAMVEALAPTLEAKEKDSKEKDTPTDT